MSAIDRKTLDAVITRLFELGLALPGGQEGGKTALDPSTFSYLPPESSTQNVTHSAPTTDEVKNSRDEVWGNPEAQRGLEHSESSLSDTGSDLEASTTTTAKICAVCLQSMADNKSFNVPRALLAQLSALGTSTTTASMQAPPVIVPVSALVAPVSTAAPCATGGAIPVQVPSTTDALANLTPAGPIPSSALRYMTPATIEALKTLDLDTIPPNPNTEWYTITVGTWIGISDDWPFVSFHVTGVSRAVYLRKDSWMEARTLFLHARNQGVCRLV